jgi:hypothetical protein
MFRIFVFAALSVTSSALFAADGRLLATGGQLNVDGMAGGGLTTWAVLSGHATNRQADFSFAASRNHSKDYTLQSFAMAFNAWERVDVSLATSDFDIGTLQRAANLPFSRLRVQTLGLKWHIAGDLIYDQMPMISAGVSYKRTADPGLGAALGAQRDGDFEPFIAVSRLFLGALGGENLLLNGTLKASRANQFGLLGFGGPEGGHHQLQTEFSAALLFTPKFAAGLEYRGKPDNLPLEEDDAYSAFIAYFPTKKLQFVLAYTDLGSIGGLDDQSGAYLSVQVSP